MRRVASSQTSIREVANLIDQGVSPDFVPGFVSDLARASAEVIAWLVRRDEEDSHTPAHHKNDDDDRPEPFATVLEVIGEHGMSEVLESISDSALFDSENEEIDDTNRVLAAKWHKELKQVIDRMDQFQRQLTDDVNQFLRKRAEEAEANN